MKTIELPGNEKSEKAVIGACLLDIEFQRFAAHTLTPDDFFNLKHREAFKFIQASALAGKPVDPVILMDSVPTIRQPDIAEFIDAIPLLNTAMHHLQIVREATVRRQLILGSKKIFDIATDMTKPLLDVTTEAYRLIRECTNGERIAISDPDVHQDAYEQMVKSWNGLPLLRTGITELDEDIGGGVFPGEIMVVIGGEGSMKTSLALNAVEDYITNVKRKVLFVSLDMPAFQINNRRLMPILHCSEREVVERVALDSEAYRAAREERSRRDGGLFKVVHGQYTIEDIERIIQFEAPAMVVIDYMTAVAGFDDELSAARAVTEALRRWKADFKCSFLVLNQMSEIALANQRKGDVGTGRGLGGGAIRREADVVLEMFKDKVDTDSTLPCMYKPLPRIVCSVVKTRRGVAGKHWSLHYEGKTMKFLGTASLVQLKNKKDREPLYVNVEFPI